MYMSEGRDARRGRNYLPLVVGLSVLLNVVIIVLFFLPGRETSLGSEVDLTILPRLNAIYNTFTFLFLLGAYYKIRRKDIQGHRRFIYAAFVTTAFFLVTYVAYHYLAESTPYGGEGVLRAIYFFFLLTHVLLAIAIVPLALYAFFTGLDLAVAKHRRIARWAMPLWLYVAFSGVVVYLMISPYY